MISDPPFLNYPVVGYFDGAAKDGICGAGMVLRMDLKQNLLLRMDAGRGKNTRAKILALWGLVFFAKSQHISKLLMLGDSKVVVDWATEIHTVHSIELYHWLGRVKGIIRLCDSLYFHHIYKEYNTLADDLSK